MIPTWTYDATVEHVVDGDTFDVAIDLGFRLTQRTRVRLHHVDTPERGTPAGTAATARVRDLLPIGCRVVLRTSKPDKYGRSLAVVCLPDGRDLATVLVAEKHAVPYEGGTRSNQLGGP
jgi:micrococcal nuclease